MLLAKNPIVSKLAEIVFVPSREIVLWVGLKAKTPLNDAGRIRLPPVCVPRLRGTCWSATAAADPQDEPPGVRSKLWGLAVWGPELVTLNSVVVVFPVHEQVFLVGGKADWGSKLLGCFYEPKIRAPAFLIVATADASTPDR